jgi:hypothetical protein
MERIPLENIYIMTLEAFSRDAAQEMERLFQWLGM